MAFEHTDQDTAQKWLADQAAWMNEPEHESVNRPAHQLDAETVRALILMVLPPITGAITSRDLKIAFRRFCVLACFVDDDLAARGFQALALAMTEAGISTTRACLSHIHCEIRDILDVSRLGRSQEARKAYSERAKAVWALREQQPRKRAGKGTQGQQDSRP